MRFGGTNIIEKEAFFYQDLYTHTIVHPVTFKTHTLVQPGGINPR